MNRSLQAQRDQMNVEFEKRMKIQWDTHRNELEVEKQKLKTTIEETRASTCTVESIKAHALALSEELVTGKNELLDLLNSIWAE
jgi:galactokinase/mevalonate kinase-like predicted kinase